MKFFILITLLLLSAFSNIYSLEMQRKISKNHFTKAQYLNRFKNNLEYPLKQLTTNYEANGDGKTSFLDKHTLDCQIGALSKFHLVQLGKTIRFEYDCIMPNDCQEKCQEIIKREDKRKCRKLKTKPEILGNAKDGGKAAQYLNTQNPKCPTGRIMQGFKLVNVAPKVYYEYTCCPAQTEHCKTHDTKEEKYGDFGTEALTKLEVSVPIISNQAITGFKLEVNYKKKMWFYKVDYCTIIG